MLVCRTTIVGLLACVAACGGDRGGVDAGPTDSSADSPQPPLTASDYCESIVEPFCSFYVRCGRMAVETAEECTGAFLETCNATFEPQYVDLEAAGLLTLSEEGLAACREHLAQVVCEQQIFELDGPCASLWRGAQEPTEACGLNVDFYVCAPDTECVIGLDFCGECQPRIELGGDCSEPTTTCGGAEYCEDGLCRARVANGQACGEGDRCRAGSACVDSVCRGPRFVAAGAACDRDNRCPYLTACIDGICRPTARLGEGCSPSTPCETGFCNSESVCEAPRENGASCTDRIQCQSQQCADNTCIPRPGSCL